MRKHTPKDILKTLFKLYKNNPGSLTKTEQVLADRICYCSKCDNFWTRHSKNWPKRCPKCNSSIWDRPLINALMAAENVDAPTIALNRPITPSEEPTEVDDER